MVRRSSKDFLIKKNLIINLIMNLQKIFFWDLLKKHCTAYSVSCDLSAAPAPSGPDFQALTFLFKQVRTGLNLSLPVGAGTDRSRCRGEIKRNAGCEEARNFNKITLSSGLANSVLVLILWSSILIFNLSKRYGLVSSYGFLLYRKRYCFLMYRKIPCTYI